MPLPDSNLRELLEVFSSLYLPGVTPLREEQAREVQARAGVALRHLREDPFSAEHLLAVHDADQSWRSLPVLDLTVYMETIARLCDALVNAEGTEGVDQVMQERFVDLISWSRTAKLWEKLGGVRMALDFPGNGPVLQSTAELQKGAGDDVTAAEWKIRAASQGVYEEWLAASRRVEAAAEWSLDQLVTDPVSIGSPFPVRVPLQGSLGRVTVGSLELAHWEICRTTSYTVPRGSKRAQRNGDLEVLYAPDQTIRVAWVTAVRLIERVDRDHNGPMHR